MTDHTLRHGRNPAPDLFPEHWNALTNIVERLAGKPVVWVLTGSMAFALQGMPVVPKDLDLQTDEGGAYALERIFEDCITRPVAYRVSGNLRSHLGALRMDGIDVEIIGDIRKRLPDGSWTPAPDLARLRRVVSVRGVQVPLLPLAHAALAYAQMGRTDRAQELLDWMEEGSLNHA